jgi:hypothetical protein
MSQERTKSSTERKLPPYAACLSCSHWRPEVMVDGHAEGECTSTRSPYSRQATTGDMRCAEFDDLRPFAR